MAAEAAEVETLPGDVEIDVQESQVVTATQPDFEEDLLKAAPELGDLAPTVVDGFTMIEVKDMGCQPAQILAVVMKGGGVPDPYNPRDASLVRYKVDLADLAVEEDSKKKYSSVLATIAPPVPVDPKADGLGDGVAGGAV